jgi:hypothetical protein
MRERLDLEMKKLQILVLTLFAVSAFIAAVASVASAAETLLALWLANGATFAGNLAVNSEGELLLEDEKVPLLGKVAVVCSGLFEGTVNGENGEDEITMLWSLGTSQVLVEPKLVGAGLLCTAQTGCETSATDIEVWPIELPLLTLLFLEEPGLFLVLVFSDGAGESVGYEVKCLVLGAVAEDECKQPNNDLEIEILNVTGGVETMEKPEPNGKCSEGGEGAGSTFSISGNIENLTEGGPLSASE